MAKVNYITYTEPVNLCKGINSNIYVREFDTETKKGASRVFVKDIPLIIPSLEIETNNASEMIEKYRSEFPQMTCKLKHFSNKKSVIWAYLYDKKFVSSQKKEEKITLPEIFLTDKTSYSQELRFFYPPYTMVEIKDDNLLLPEKYQKSTIDLDTILSDKKCALDIETMDYDDPEKERISNVNLNFGNEKYIMTTFKTPFNEFNGYKIIRCKDTDEIKKTVEQLIKEKDPLILYGYNISFDQEKLRELGSDEYLPGVGGKKPIFKSVQGIRNMITKGRFTIDLYGYLFMYHNLFENNKLETHAKMSGIEFKKDLPYSVLAYKTKLGEQGSVKDMEEVLTYVSKDGDVTYELGDKYVKNIIMKSKFVKRNPETICTTSGKNIMKEYWSKKYFFGLNTWKDRYNKFYKEDEFIIEDHKNEYLNLNRRDGLFKDVSAVYPILFIKSLWDSMIEGTTENLRFQTPQEKYESYQTLNEYISNTLKEFIERKKSLQKRPEKEWIYNYVMQKEYGASMTTIEKKINEESKVFNELLPEAGLINYSKKFLFVKNPQKIEERKLGFVYGNGNLLSCDEKMIMKINSGNGLKMIYQGVGISKGKKSMFDADLMREFLIKRLNLEEEGSLLEFLNGNIKNLKEGKIPREKLVYHGLGVIDGEEVSTEEFLTSDKQPDYNYYAKHFFDAYKKILITDFSRKKELKKIFEC